MENIRQPKVAGTFYPAHKNDLLKILNQFNTGSIAEIPEDITCLIAPHAGYIYSGRIAAEAYSYIKNKKYDTVIVIAPSHYDYFTGCSITLNNYATPLGQITTNRNFVETLNEHSNIVNISEMGHGQEHALEVQLPFLQTNLPEFRHVPVVMGRQNLETAQLLAEDLYSTIKTNFSSERFLIVCSSDLSHFYDVEHARMLDGVIHNDIEAFDAEKLNSDIISKKGEACGFGPILTGMILSKMMGADKSKVVAYGTSGDVSRDYNSVVGYLSAILYKN